MIRRSAAALLATVLTVALVACTPDEEPAAPTAQPSESPVVAQGARYVALGDSYTAAPGIGASDGTDGCFRSENNYPHLVAERLDLALTDVSCGGATTAALTRPQSTVLGGEVAPQLDALGPETDLVTIRIGGNDYGLYQLISRICPALADRDPEGQPCADEAERAEQDLDDLLRLQEKDVVGAVRKVVQRAPEATVLVVGYPAVVPERGSCADLPLADGDYAFALKVLRGLNASMQAAARATDTRYLDVYAATRGHDICSDDPWVAGRSEERKGVPWHPYVEEQEATATVIEDALAG